MDAHPGCLMHKDGAQEASQAPQYHAAEHQMWDFRGGVLGSGMGWRGEWMEDDRKQ